MHNLSGHRQESLQDLVSQYHHRILSLEADLKDRARNRELTNKAFKKRVEKLKKMHQDLESLKSLCTSQGVKHYQSDLGLPNLEHCDPQEIEICRHSLEERLDTLKEIEKDTRKVRRWVEKASAGDTGAIIASLRFSNLRRIISRWEKRQIGLEHDAKLSQEKMSGILATTDKGASNNTNRSTLEGLISLFNLTEQVITRVARLKARVNRAKADIKSKETWIAEQEAMLKATRPSWSPPTPTAVMKLIAANSTAKIKREKIQVRKKLAEQFWEDVISSYDIRRDQPTRSDLTTGSK